ncbi:MAG: GntR family transcriptional regulator [Hyphomicrobium sp.]|jgi:DNA-binding GntR family transcriptional regulator
MTEKGNRSEQAYLALRRAIIEQAIRPGDKLREDELGALFGMSRTLVRQILGRLNAEGLVTIGGKRPATVVTPSLDDALAVFEVRRALEREVIELVMKRWKPEYAKTLEAHVEEEVAASGAGKERVSIRLAGEFHALLAGMSGNPVLVRYVSEVVSRCSLILAVYGRPHSAECGVQEHREIIRALKAGDVAAARRVMEHHIGEVEARALIATQAEESRSLGDVLANYVRNAGRDKPASGSVTRVPKSGARKERR